MKKFKIAIAIVLGIFALIAGTMFLIQSSFGQNLGLKYLKEALLESGYQVEIGKIEGTIPHAMELRNIKIHSGNLDISIDSIETRLSLLALLKKELLFSDVKASGITWVEREGVKTEGLGTGIPFELTIQHFQFFNVKGPKIPSTDFEGSLKIQKKNKELRLAFDAKTEASKGALLHVILHRNRDGFYRIKGNLKTPTLNIFPEPPPFEAAISLQFMFRGKDRLAGKLQGSVTPQIENLGELQPYIDTSWQLASHIMIDPEKGWNVSNLSLKSEQVAVHGSVDLSVNGDFKEADPFCISRHGYPYRLITKRRIARHSNVFK